MNLDSVGRRIAVVVIVWAAAMSGLGVLLLKALQ